MANDHDAVNDLRRSAKRSYELGRLRWALTRALIVGVVVGSIGLFAVGKVALPWLPLPFVAWAFAAHRGGAFQAGALRGLGAGIVALLVPLQWMRPCCDAGMAGDACCSAPGMCLLAGAVLGGAFALLLPRVEGARRIEAACGLFLGAAVVGALRCQGMLVGEALGLLSGLGTGLAALSLARAAVERSLR